MLQAARLTYYHPRDVRDAEEIRREGPDHDTNRQPLHYWEDYDASDPASFVGLAADTKIFKRDQVIYIKELPGYRFRIRDTGGGFYGKTGLRQFDVPVKNRSTGNKIPEHVHWSYSPIDDSVSRPRPTVTKATNSDLWILGAVSLVLLGIVDVKSNNRTRRT